MSAVAVVEPGLLTTIQDGGRPGHAHLGVPPSGALDLPSLERANRLVGNPPAAAALEATLLGPTLRFERDVVFAVTGAEAEVTVGRRVVASGNAVEAARGDILHVGRCVSGVRVYVAFRGGIAVEPTLGSRATDLLTGLGPPPLRAGDELALGPEPPNLPARPSPVARAVTPEPTLLIHPGPRADWFVETAIVRLVSEPWRVSASSNRVGVRLEGPPLERRAPGELLSEGVVTGALQVPASGQPILLLADHPTTGGYPVIAVVATADLPLAGQLAPASTVRFRLVI
jgi:biotin-dependent carboxylase-like uncharacterized protein